MCASDNNQPMRVTLIMLQLSIEKVNNNTQKVKVTVICKGHNMLCHTGKKNSHSKSVGCMWGQQKSRVNGGGLTVRV
jgi:hypothetical protein